MEYFLLAKNISITIAFLVYATRVSQESKTYRIVFVYITLNMVYEWCEWFLSDSLTTILFHYFIFLQLIILGYFYHTCYPLPRQKKTLLVVLGVSLVILLGQFVIAPSTYYSSIFVDMLVTCFVVVFFSIIHHYNQIGKIKVFYYFNLGMIIFFIGSVVAFLFFTSLSVLFKEDYYIELFAISALLFDVLLSVLLLKDWLVLRRGDKVFSIKD